MSRYLSVRSLLVVLGVGPTLGFALVVGYEPELLPAAVSTGVDQLTGVVGMRTAILAAGGLLACLGLLGLWTWRTTDRTAVLSRLSPERPDREVAVTGGPLTAEFETRRAGQYHPEQSLEPSLRAALADLYGREFDDSDRAESYVDDGEWTDDRVAAATLTATESVDFPLVYRLYAWLYPDHAYSYRIQRTLRAVEEACGAELTAYAPPDRNGGRLGQLRALFDSDSGGDTQ